MKTTYSIGTSDDGYCICCGTLGKCIDMLYYNAKTYKYRKITEYSICKVKHPDSLTLDWGMGGECYLLNGDGEIDDKNDEILTKWKIIKLKKSDLKFIKKHLSYN